MCRRAALTLFVLIVLAISGAAWLATRRESAVTTSVPPFAPASPQQVHAAEERLRADLSPTLAPPPAPARAEDAHPDPAIPAPAATQAPQEQDVTVRIRQDDLNTLLAGNPRIRARLTASGVSSIRVALAEPNRIAAVAQVDYQGHAADVTAGGTLSVTDQGTLTFTTRSLTVGLLPLPEEVADKMQTQIDAALGQVQATLPLRVMQVRVEDKQLVLTGPQKHAEPVKTP